MFFIVSNRLGNIAAPRKRNVPSSTSHTTHVLYHPIPGRGASGCLPKSGFRTPSWLEFRYFDPVRYLGPSPSSPDKSQQMLVCLCLLTWEHAVQIARPNYVYIECMQYYQYMDGWVSPCYTARAIVQYGIICILGMYVSNVWMYDI